MALKYVGPGPVNPEDIATKKYVDDTVAAGGGGGGTPTLSAVLTAGDTASLKKIQLEGRTGAASENTVVEGGMVRVVDINTGISTQLKPDRLLFSEDGYSGVLQVTSGVAAGFTWDLPNQSGTIALTSDLPEGGAPNLEEVLNAGTYATNSINLIDGFGFQESAVNPGGLETRRSDFTAGILANADGVISIGVPSGASFSNLTSAAVTETRDWVLPDKSGTIAIDDGVIELVKGVSDPATPANDRVKVFAKKVSGRVLPAFKGPSGLQSTLQPNIFRNRIGLWSPAGGTGTSNIGFGVSTTGTMTGANVAAGGTAQAWMRRVEALVTTGSTSAVAGIRSTNTFCARGNSADAAMGMGGFFICFRWGPATGLSNANRRAFAGLRADLSAPTDVAPSSLFNILGMGWEAADTNIQFLHNDASGTATKVNLGASFPKPTADRTKVYEVCLFCPPGASFVDWQVEDVGTSNIASGSAVSNLPVDTTALGALIYSSVGGTNAVTGVSVVTMYYECDN